MMKYLFAYFSLTNNTKFLAQSIQKGLLSVEPDAEITLKPLEKIPFGTAEEFKEYDVIGFGCLTWVWDAPVYVKKYMTAMPEDCLKGKKTFVFATAGGQHGCTCNTLARLATKKGGMNVAVCTCLAPGNYTPLLKPAKEEKPVIGWPSSQWKKGEEFGKILPKFTGLDMKKSYIPYAGVSGWVGWGVNGVLRDDWPAKNHIGKIEWNEETCKGPKCSKCVKGCPWNCLTFEDKDGVMKIVKDDKACHGCCKCINICPTTSWVRKKNKKGEWRQYFFAPKVLVESDSKKGEVFLSKAEYEKVKIGREAPAEKEVEGKAGMAEDAE